MAYSFESVPDDDPLVKTVFHHVLVAFGAPAAWPAWAIYILAGSVIAATAALWATLDERLNTGLVIFLIQFSFFIADRDLLESLARRRLSFAPWQSQILALLLPRAASALFIGLVLPFIGWQTSLFLNVFVQVLGTLALYRGAAIEPGLLALTELAIQDDRLPSATPPLRILHISDLHIERLGSREARLLELVRLADPDAILITGDYVNLSFNTDPVTHDEVRALLTKLVAPLGVYAVLGSPPVDLPDVIPALFEGLPVRLLRDEWVEITGQAGRTVTLIGLDCHHDMARDASTLAGVLSSAPAQGTRILLYHSPELMPDAVKRGVDLYLCGHTHGGQVRLPVIGPLVTSSRLGRRYVMGHYREGRTHLYVSRGVGFEGLGAPRVRFLCPPEITLVTLGGHE